MKPKGLILKRADKSEQSKQPPAIWDGEFSIVENKFLRLADAMASKGQQPDEIALVW